MEAKFMNHPKKPHPLQEVWNRHPGFLKNETRIYEMSSLDRIIGEIFSVGEYYYYTLRIADSTLRNHHDNILQMHGFKTPPQHLGEISELTHPDDLTFVQEAELMTVEKIKEIGFEHMMNLKSSYCFRLRMASGRYEMFHHQSVHPLKSGTGRLLEAVHIHTNIQHVAPKNNYFVVVSGIGVREDFHKMSWPGKYPSDNQENPLSKREIEIISLLAKGLDTAKISEQLCISSHTVRTHRKNMLAKTKCRTSSELICKAFEVGYL